MPNNSLVHPGDLSKPVTTLIKKISTAIGGIFKPWQIVRVAKAEAEAAQIQAVADIEIADLHRRAFRRFLEEEAKRQYNIEAITQKALPHLRDNSEPETIKDDWITNFFDKSRIVSDDEMQQLWGHILASEANEPGSFSRRTVNLIADLDKADALLFAKLCGFVWNIEDPVPLIYQPMPGDIYNRYGISFEALSHLESLGLVQFNGIAGFVRSQLPRKMQTYYHGRLVELTFPKDTDNELSIGNVILTRAGRELSAVCGPQKIDEFFDFIVAIWARQKLTSVS